ncbi:MAG: hypothetical protein J2P17_06925 [Mycobacterium sp.]|nr:hypothetical protein [Mycobacterium sp.]
MGVLASWRTPDGGWLVDQLYSEPVDYRIWVRVDGHVLVAELRGSIERLDEYLAGKGVNIADLVPVGDEGEDPDCE